MSKKINLKDTTFLIPVKIDTTDRARNLFLVVSYLLSNFDKSIDFPSFNDIDINHLATFR